MRTQNEFTLNNLAATVWAMRDKALNENNSEMETGVIVIYKNNNELKRTIHITNIHKWNTNDEMEIQIENDFKEARIYFNSWYTLKSVDSMSGQIKRLLKATQRIQKIVE